jgi:hypothetical protein
MIGGSHFLQSRMSSCFDHVSTTKSNSTHSIATHPLNRPIAPARARPDACVRSNRQAELIHLRRDSGANRATVRYIS